MKSRERNLSTAPGALIGVDEFQPAIPWRDALQQRPPPLRPAALRMR